MLDFITKIVFFELKYLFINKKSFGDTKRTLSVVLIKMVALTLSTHRKNIIYGKSKRN